MTTTTTSAPAAAAEKHIEFEVLPGSLEAPFTDHFPRYGEGLIRTIPGGYVYHPEYSRHAEKYHALEPRKEDVWIRTFPRSGTTIVSEMVWLMLNNFDYEAASKTALNHRSPNPDPAFIADWSRHAIPKEIRDEHLITLDEIARLPSPRIVKTHHPTLLMHPQVLDGCKNIYIARNPKDTILSFYYFYRLMKVLDFQGDIELFAQYFMEDKLIFSPYIKHVLEGWNQRHHPNMLFLFYEDLKKDLRGETLKVAKHLNVTMSEDQLTKLLDHLRIERFKENNSVNMEDVRKSGVGMFPDRGIGFVRKGKTGDWKNHFSQSLSDRVDEWTSKNFAGTGLTFLYELDQQD